MNEHAPSSASSASSRDERDEPSPSRSAGPGTADDQPPEPVLRIGGEAAHAIDAAWLRDYLERAAAQIAVPIARIDIQVVRDEAMTRLHEQFLGIASTTDVLTFPASHEPGRPIEADIAICLDEARWRADQHEHAVERELLLYALHGLLHCAGHDDHDDAGFAAMHAEEDRILEAIGIGRTFWATDVQSHAGSAGHDAEPVRTPLHRSGSPSEWRGRSQEPSRSGESGHERDQGIEG